MTAGWKPIEDLAPDWKKLSSSELRSLAGIWAEQSQKLADTESLVRFNERLAREWAIETGILENLYTIDRGVTELLIERGIEASLIPHGTTDRPADYVVALVEDQKSALEGVFDFVAQKRSLSTSYIKELHQALTLHQETVEGHDQFGRRVQTELLRGEWKLLPNNPTRRNGSLHEYCPPEHVASEIDRLLEMHARHREEDVPPEIEAAWLHHRFTQIHPFQDGNGRLARAIASMVFVRAHWFPLVIRRDDRSLYISSLEAADDGDLAPLVGLFVKVEKRAFRQALSISENVLTTDIRAAELVKSAAERLRARQRGKEEELAAVLDVAQQLSDFAHSRLQRVQDQISEALVSIDPHYQAYVERSTEDTSHWFRQQIIEAARQLDYYADTRSHRSWNRLKIREERQTEIVVAFHGMGRGVVGIVAASAFLEFRDRNENGTTDVEGPHPLCEEVFQFSIGEEPHEVRDRFEQWLERLLLVGLAEWRQQL